MGWSEPGLRLSRNANCLVEGMRRRKRLLHNVCAACLVCCVSLFAAAPAGPAPGNATHDPLNRDTPQSSVFSFLEACRTRDYARAVKYMDLEALPEDQRLKDGTQLAKQLSQILDRDAKFDIGALSHEADGNEKDGLPADRELVDTFVVDGRPQPLELEHQNASLRLKSMAVRAGKRPADTQGCAAHERFLY